MTDTMEQGEGCGEKFTPGPWRVISNSPTDIYVRDDGGLIARGATPTFYPDQHDRYVAELAEYAANARLIASAPELYEALKEASFEVETLLCDTVQSSCVLVDGVYDELTADPDDRAEIERLKTMLDKMEAALLKASGGKVAQQEAKEGTDGR